MGIFYDKKTNTFYLEGKKTSYVFCIDAYGRAVSLHYGQKTGRDDLLYLPQRFDRGFAANFAGAATRKDSLDTTALEYPVYGIGDYRFPAVLTVDESGNRIEDLKYVSHAITATKPVPSGAMPVLRGGKDVETLVVTLASDAVEVKLFYSVYPDCDAIARRTEIRNKSNGTLRLQRASSFSVDLPDMDYDFISLHGRHTQERTVERTPLRHGVQSIYSLRGASSHQHNPFFILARKNTDELRGEAYAFHYVYGGSFEMRAECDQLYTTRICAGFPSADFEWLLAAGETFVTPESVLAYSEDGLGALSRNLHDLYRGYMIAPRFALKERPIVINNWEATYFTFDTEKLFEIIDSCEGLGVDTFVLDDGWFGKRDDDNSGLGDWVVNEKKLTGGLKPIIERCKQRGLQFGLWFEPEMVNPDSDLYRAHPDWCLHVPGKPHTTSRGQLVLDLGRNEVVEYIKNAVANILRNNDIRYVKWDFNRHLCDVYSVGLPANRQQEAAHRFMLGFYELAKYLTETFPDILFEGCSGGGGRFDPAMLAYFPQSWTSDNSDAYNRTQIQYGTSYAYPLSCMTGHVSVTPNHQTGRITPLAARAAVAQNCIFGYELNPKALSAEDRAAIRAQTEEYRRIAPLILGGDLYRLLNPFTDNGFAQLIVDKQKTQAVVTVFTALARANGPVRRLKLYGLDENKTYRIEELDLTLSGRTLLSAGLPLPPTWGDFTAKVWHLTAV